MLYQELGAWGPIRVQALRTIGLIMTAEFSDRTSEYRC